MTVKQSQENVTTISAAAGATIAMDPGPVWLERNAYRSLLGGHSIAAAALERRAEGRLVTYLALGRTGSTTTAGLIGQPRRRRLLAPEGWRQIDELAETIGFDRVDALLIYIGINELGVTGTLVTHDCGCETHAGRPWDDHQREFATRSRRHGGHRHPDG